MTTLTEYHLIYRKLLYNGSQHSKVTKIRPTLPAIMREYEELKAWGERVPEMELIIDGLTKRTYTEEDITPAA